MDIRQFRYFIAIAQEKQITAAARRLNMAQPPLSQQLKLIEEELGVLLFERKKSSLVLTAEGEAFLQRAQEVVSKFDEAITEVRELGDVARGTLSVGATLYCSSLLLGKIRQNREQHPQLTYKVWEGDAPRLSELLARRDLEVAISNAPLTLPDVTSLPLEGEPFVLVLPKEWPHSLPDEVDFCDLAELPLMLLRPPHGESLYNRILGEFHQRGVHPKILCECNDSAMLLSLVSDGFGVTLLPSTVLSLHSSDRYMTRPLRDNPLVMEPRVYWRKNSYLSKAAQEFLRLFS